MFPLTAFTWTIQLKCNSFQKQAFFPNCIIRSGNLPTVGREVNKITTHSRANPAKGREPGGSRGTRALTRSDPAPQGRGRARSRGGSSQRRAWERWLGRFCKAGGCRTSYSQGCRNPRANARPAQGWRATVHSRRGTCRQPQVLHCVTAQAPGHTPRWGQPGRFCCRCS